MIVRRWFPNHLEGFNSKSSVLQFALFLDSRKRWWSQLTSSDSWAWLCHYRFSSNPELVLAVSILAENNRFALTWRVRQVYWYAGHHGKEAMPATDHSMWVVSRFFAASMGIIWATLPSPSQCLEPEICVILNKKNDKSGWDLFLIC